MATNELPEIAPFITDTKTRRAYKHQGQLFITIKGIMFGAPEDTKAGKDEFYEVLRKSSPGCLFVRTRPNQKAEQWYPIVDTRSTIRGTKAKTGTNE